MVYKPLAVRVALVAGFRRALPVFRSMIVVAVAVVMWESRRDFQGVWEGWKAGFMAFHAFHTPAFPWLVFARSSLLLVKRVFEGASVAGESLQFRTNMKYCDTNGTRLRNGLSNFQGVDRLASSVQTEVG